jgi:uroporphyrinogen decarboxylase
MALTSKLTSRERLLAAIAGDEVDRPPVSLWQHLPERDQTAEELAKATIDWFQSYPVDFVKFMPPGDYPTIDWGAESVYQGSPSGTRTTIRFPVNSVEDWRSLRPVAVRNGFNATMVEALKRTRQTLPSEVPLLQTIFSPLTIAMKLSNRQAIEHLRSHPADVHQALAIIGEVTAAFVEASMRAGADGLFFATQCADHNLLDEVEYREFGLHYDLEVLAGLPEPAIVMLHLHGESPMFQLEGKYPAQILNWHDQHAAPGLVEGQGRSGRCVAGGMNERTIATDDPTRTLETARVAIAELSGRSLIIAPGCVIPTNTPPQTILSVLREFAPDLMESHSNSSA